MIMVRQVEKTSSRLVITSKVKATEITESNNSNKHEVKKNIRICKVFVILFDT